MEYNNSLVWQKKSASAVYKCPVFSVLEQRAVAPDGKEKVFSLLDSSSWAVIVPVQEHGKDAAEFLMVRQWRPGTQALSLEFPGGVIEADEKPEDGARRELEEETGYAAGKLTLMAAMSPNPAVYNNSVYFFLAEDLRRLEHPRAQDADEFILLEKIKVRDVISCMGTPPYTHALMAAALFYYCRLTRGA